MDPAEPQRTRHAPKSGLIIAVIAVLTVIIIFAATRRSGPAPTVPGNHEPPANRPPGNLPAPQTGSEAHPAVTVPGMNSRPTAPPPAASGPAAAGGMAKGTVTTPPRQVNPADLPPDHPQVTADTSPQVGIQWLGYSCFYIHSPGGVAVVTDPYDSAATGLPAPGIRGHLVTISTNSPAHNDAADVPAFMNDTKQVVEGKEAQRGDMRIIPIPTSGGQGSNWAYLIQAGTLRIAHLGDLGGPLTAEQVKALGAVDILMLPVGGGALSPKEAVQVAKQVNPRVILPMAYATPDMSGPAGKLRPVEDFIAASPYAVTAKDSDVMMISKAELPASTEVYTLKYGH